MTAGVISQPAERQKGEIRLINERPSAVLVPPILAARRYVSPRSRPVTPGEESLFRLALDLASNVSPLSPEELRELELLAKGLAPVFHAR